MDRERAISILFYFLQIIILRKEKSFSIFSLNLIWPVLVARPIFDCLWVKGGGFRDKFTFLIEDLLII
jgi:hypothetical protein